MVLHGYKNGFFQPFDYSLHMMNAYGQDEEVKYKLQMLTIIQNSMETKGECFDTLDWLMMGQHMARSQEEEVAF